MDEPFGRAHARLQGVAVTGLAGVLLAARRAGLVPSIRPYFERLERSDFRLSEEVIRTVLEKPERPGRRTTRRRRREGVAADQGLSLGCRDDET